MTMPTTRLVMRFLLGVALLTPGCATTWQAQPMPPAEALRGGATEILVTLKDRSKVRMRDPAAIGDSLIGWTNPSQFEDAAPARLSYPIADVGSVSIRKSDTGINIATGAIAGGLLFVVSVGVLWAIYCSAGCD